MFLKYKLLGFSILFCFKVIAATNQVNMVGGCGAPQFLTSYDQNVVTQISQVKHVKHINISYPPQLHALAAQIASGIGQSPSGAVIKLEQLDLKDTKTTKYRHDAVVVVACFR